MRKTTVILPFCLLALLSCAHYTSRDGVSQIQQESPATTRTKLSDINGTSSEPDDIALLMDEAGRLTDDNEALRAEIAALEEENSRLQADNAELRQQTTAAGEEADENETLKAQVSDLEARNTDTAQKLESANAALESKNQETAQAQAEVDRLSGENTSLRAQLEALQADNAALAAENENLRAQPEPEAAETIEIPDLSTVSLPYVWRSGKTFTVDPKKPIGVLLLPLGEEKLEDSEIEAVLSSVSDLDAPVTILTGSQENVRSYVAKSGVSAVFTEQGAILSDLVLDGDPSQSGAVFTLDGNAALSFGVVDLPRRTDILASVAAGNAPAAAKEDAAGRKALLGEALDEGEAASSAIVGASLYEPAASDWGRFSSFSWRTGGNAWPLVEYAADRGWGDTWRQTHYSPETDPGNTAATPQVAERIDFLFGRRVIPLTSALVNLGPESQGEEQRRGVYATYLVP